MLLSLLEVVWDGVKDLIEVSPESYLTVELQDPESHFQHSPANLDESERARDESKQVLDHECKKETKMNLPEFTKVSDMFSEAEITAFCEEM